MSAHRQLLHFRSPGSGGSPVSAGLVLRDVFLNEIPAPVGHVVLLPACAGTPELWIYVLGDGRPTGLQTALSRQALESDILEYYYLEMTGDHRRTA